MKKRKQIDISDQAEDVLSNKKLSKVLLDMLPFPAVIVNKERILLYANTEAEKIESIPGTHCWDTFGKQASISEEDKMKFAQNGEIPAKGIKCTFCELENALEGQETIKKIVTIGNTTLEIFWIPIDKNTHLHYGIVIDDK